jgi:hypothetical protein
MAVLLEVPRCGASPSVAPDCLIVLAIKTDQRAKSGTKGYAEPFDCRNLAKAEITAQVADSRPPFQKMSAVLRTASFFDRRAELTVSSRYQISQRCTARISANAHSISFWP